SYDDREAIADFVSAQKIPYPMLSDVDSRGIREYGSLHTEVEPTDRPVSGTPFPGTYMVDEDGRVIEKFFYDTYKRRDGPENMIDAALGEILLSGDEPSQSFGDDDVRVTATLHGAGGVLKQGAMRTLVVRFEIRDGLHIYGDPVPEGMIATRVEVQGPPGLVVEEAVLPATETLHLKGMDLDLQVWSGRVDIVIPVYANAELLSEMRPLDDDKATIEVTVRYQACDDDTCLFPRTEKLSLEVPMAPVDVQALPFHQGHGQNEHDANSRRHMMRLVARLIRKHPIGALKSIGRQIKLDIAARRRQR
ncbi:MAG: redoxin domain-containing protein, partial [bacterium]|nr:redoxin domain-containing protein [bacterium]